jgi:hypothetical protein
MTSWRPFPPTTKVQLDEKWSFVAKKVSNCDPGDQTDRLGGDQWDFVALDPGRRRWRPDSRTTSGTWRSG